MDEFPQLRGQIRGFGADISRGYMATRPDDDLERVVIHFNPRRYSDAERLKRQYARDLQAHYTPQGTTWEQAGVHELGHVALARIISRRYATLAEMEDDWNRDISARQIVRQAWDCLLYTSNEAYLAYGREVLGFPIADSRKEKLLAELHKRYSVVLNHEARHVSVMVAGPARYNSKQLDHSDDILRSTHEFCVWFDGVRKQVESAAKEERNEERILKDIEQRDQNGVNPMGKLAAVSYTHLCLCYLIDTARRASSENVASYTERRKR